MPFKICVVGCGGHSSYTHGPAFKRYVRDFKETSLAACCDLDKDKAKKYCEEFGFRKYYTDVELMLDSEKPDAVALILPEFIEAQVAARILEKGYPLILEKPPGKDSNETRLLIEAAKKYNVPNQVAFNRRYHPIVREMKKILKAEHAADAIQNIRYEMYRYNRTENIFWATAIHGFDLVRDLAGSDYKHIQVFYQDFPALGENVSNFFMYCTFKSGATAQLSFCPIGGINSEQAAINIKDHTFILDIGYYTKGTLKQYTQNDQLIRDIKGEDLFTAERVYDYNGYYHENEDFFNDIRNGRYPAGDLTTCVQSMEVAEGIAKKLTEMSW